jgi:hypothetical protein
MKRKSKFITIIITVMPILITTIMPVGAAYNDNMMYATPRYSVVNNVTLGIGFDTNNVAYVTLTADMFSNGSGISGIAKLFNSEGTCIAAWSVSDYVEPIGVEFTHQCEYGKTYTATFEGYGYSNNGTAPDRLELSVTGTCRK